MLKNRILSAVGGEEKLYSNDVFTSYVRTGTGADAVINTGIDMTKGYMLWSKSRSAATDHAVYDSARGVTLDLVTNSTAAQTTQSTGLKAVSSTGHTVGSLAKINTSGATYVDWVWKKAPKFFDVVTYTGNGVAGRQIPHELGIAPGMVVVKATSTTGDWIVWHRGIADGYSNLILNATSAAGAVYYGSVSEPSSTVFKVGGVNTNGITYVAYLFAHDPSADGIIQCGSFTTDGSGNATVTLGWEPQYVLVKHASSTGNWIIQDSMRGFIASDTVGARLYADASYAEDANASIRPTATGFSTAPAGIGASVNTLIYLAIRRPNKPPTTGTEVYNAIARTGTGAAATVTGVGFAPDLHVGRNRNSAANATWSFSDRLRGLVQLYPNLTNAEASDPGHLTAYGMADISVGASSTVNASSYPYINHFFKRSPGFMDVVCYTGTGAARTVPHSLGVAPELMIVKSRSAAVGWVVGSAYIGADDNLIMNDNSAVSLNNGIWNNTRPTASVFSVGPYLGANGSAGNYVAYLFATKAGISKVGSYTGNGSSQTINCGFTTGARFVLIKATSTTGNWIVADSTRGILSGADPALYLNSTAAEITGVDWVDPNIAGFDIIQEGTMNANVNGTNYIYLAIS